MNGRNFFEKYNKYIKLLVCIEKKLPQKYRKRKLEKIINKHGRIAMLKRYILISTLAKKVGVNVAVFPGVYFEHIENLSIGNNVSIHQMCYIDAEGGIDIGNDVSIAHRTTILSSNHSYSEHNVAIKYQKMIFNKTILENYIWIGCNCTILAGIHIGEGCVIGANAVVTHPIDNNSVAVGNPAVVIKRRK